MPDGASVFENKRGTVYYVLDKPLLTGSAITNAKVGFNEQFGQPVVSIDFTKDGSKVFADITDKNKGKNLAIVIDDIVQSDPLINSKIPDGKAIIEGNFTTEDARLLASVLRAGALPTPIKIIEERKVGPSLGDDAIKKGFFSSLIGVLAIFIFMIVYYRLSGLIANIALSLNIIILIAVMIFFQFTLTLPGLAGAALMLAMSVDANVLILERIREELAIGKTVRVAVDTAYQKVFWTIFDANITTIIAAIFLFQFGTGPIKGFAITISIGLIISMFTAITVTKLIYEFLFRKNIFFKIRV
jgi:protein-export membrane protein SecD